MRIARRALVLCLLVMMVLPASAQAAVQGQCAKSDTTRVLLYENASGDTSDGNDILRVCDHYADLSAVNHTIPSNCNNGFWQGGTTWTNCASSWVIWLPSNKYIACAYWAPNYIGVLDSHIGPRSGTRWNFSDPDNDNVESVRIVFNAAGAQADDCTAV